MNLSLNRKILIAVLAILLVFILFLFITFNNYHCEVVHLKDLDWQKMYGGSDQDCAYFIHQTIDGGYITVGISKSSDITGINNYGNFDIYILKLDSTGDIEWQQMLGGTNADIAYVVQQTADGYIIVGQSDSTDISDCVNNGGFDAIILKLDKNGKVAWWRMFGGDQDDLTISVHQTSDGGYIVTGESESTDIPDCVNNGNADMYIVKLDSEGNIEWQKLYGGINEDRALSIQQTADNGYIVFGYSNSIISGCINHGDYDYYVLKLDSSGNIEWHQMYGGNSREWGFSIQQTAEGGYVACGFSESNDISGCTRHGEWDSYVIKLNGDGEIEWQKMVGGSSKDLFYQIQQTFNGDYITIGGSWSTDIQNCPNYGGRDYYIAKISSSGTIEWQKLYGGCETDYASSIALTSDGGYVISGGSGSKNINGVVNHGEWDFYIVKLAPASQ